MIMIAAASNVPGIFIVKRLIFLEPFVLGVAVLTLFQPHGGIKFLIVTTRSTLCIATLVLLSNTTAFSDILDVLKRAKVPGLMITTIALMYRYLFVLKDESARMWLARASAHLPGAIGTGGRRWQRCWANCLSDQGQGPSEFIRPCVPGGGNDRLAARQKTLLPLFRWDGGNPIGEFQRRTG